MDHHHLPNQESPTNQEHNSEPPSAEGGIESSGAGVLEIIAQVEQQLSRVREAQNLQEAELAALAERFHQLEESERAMAGERESMDGERESLAERLEELERMQIEIGRERERWEAEQRDRENRLNQQQHAMNQRDAEFERRQQELNNELDRLRDRERQIGEMQDAMNREREQLQQRVAEAERSMEQAESQSRELTQQLAERDQLLQEAATASNDANNDSASSAHEAELRERDARIESLNNTIEELRQQLDERSSSQSEHGNPDDEAEIEQLRNRIAELEQELVITRDRTLEEERQAADELRDKAKRIALVAAHLRRRHARLKKMKSLLQQRSAVGSETPSADRSKAIHDQHEAIMQKSHEVAREREEVSQMRASLAAQERAMILRWARPRTITVMLGLLLLLGANIVAAWGLANWFMPAERTASITVEPRIPTGVSMSAEDLEQWQDWHANIVLDDSFVRSLATRMRERRLDAFSDAVRLRATLKDHLTIDRGPRGEITYTLAGRDAAALHGVLDVLASSLVIESDRQASARGDRALAVARNARQDGANLRFAVMNPWKLQDERLISMLAFLGGTLMLTFIAMWLIHTRLIRAKHLFDEVTSTIASDDDDTALRPMW